MKKPQNSKINGKVTKRRSTHLPVRRRRGSHITVTGKFPSAASEHMVEFEGLREHDFLMYLSYEPTCKKVQRAETIHYEVDERRYKYTADFLVTYLEAEGVTRRPELCEVKTWKMLKKNAAQYRDRFRAAHRHCREKGWRFRVITEKTIPRIPLYNLDFLSEYRHAAPNEPIEEALKAALKDDAAPTANELVEQLVAQEFDSSEVICQIWRLVAQQVLSTRFDSPLAMKSPIFLRSWTLSDLRPRRGTANDAKLELESTPFHALPLETVGFEGPAVTEYVPGKVYARTDRSGYFTLVQLEDAVSGTVREHGSDRVEVVPLAHLTDVRATKSDAARMLPDNSSEEVKEAERRFKSIEPYIDQRRVDRDQAAKCAEEYGVSTKTWLRWRRTYRRNPVLSSLFRKKRNDIGQGRFGELESLIHDYVCEWARSNASMIDTHQDLCDEIKRRNNAGAQPPLKPPVYSTFLYRCRTLSKLERDTLRSGKRLANLNHGLNEGSLEAHAPLQLIQIDHTPLPIQVVDEEQGIAVARPYITVLIDIANRTVPGFYVTLEDPGDLSTGQAISMAVLPKTEMLKRHGLREDAWPCAGIMRKLHMDNAGEFHGNMLELGCKEYRIEPHFRKVKQPNYGAYIEAYLGNLSKKLRGVPGATLGGPDELGDRVPEEEATMTLAKLEEWILWLLVEYHNTPHSGLNEQTPLSRWKEGFRGTNTRPGIGKVRLPTDVAKFKIDFLPLAERTVGVKGIVWDYIHYSHPALQRWVNAHDPKNVKLARQFLVRRDPRDLSRIYFWDLERREYLIIPYRNPTRPAISLWEYRALREFVLANYRRELDEDLLFEAREQRRRIVEESKTQTAIKQRAVETERRRAAAAQAAVFYNDIAPAQPPAAPPQPPAASADLYDDSDIESFTESSA